MINSLFVQCHNKTRIGTCRLPVLIVDLSDFEPRQSCSVHRKKNILRTTNDSINIIHSRSGQFRAGREVQISMSDDRGVAML